MIKPSGVITIFTREKAVKLVQDRIMLIGGLKARLFQNKLTEFLNHLFRRDYMALGQLSHDADLIFQTESLKTHEGLIRAGGMELFKPLQASQTILFQAEEYTLPVAMFTDELVRFTNQLYLDHYILISPDTEQAIQVLAPDKEVIMTLREK